MSLTIPPAPPASAALLAATRFMLRPLVRLLMSSGITFPVMADVLRRLFVEVAGSDLLLEPKARTDSRISLLTGVHRKEIRRLRELPADDITPPEVVTTGSQIIARWLAVEPFVDAMGQPRPLARFAQPGVIEPSFDALVASVTTDIRPRAVLDDWLTQGLVTINAQDCVTLRVEAFIPRPGGREQLFYFGRNLHDHIAASVANVNASDTAPFLDRTVHYDGLTPAQGEELEAFARAAAVKVLVEVNRKALELADKDAAGGTEPEKTPSSCRVNFGVFIFSDVGSGAGLACADLEGRAV